MNTERAKCLRWAASIFLLLVLVRGDRTGAEDGIDRTATSPAITLKLAILAPLTGPAAALGRSARDGAQLAIEELNASGGILGMTVESVIEDTACDATVATNVTNKVINQDGVRYVIGDVCSRSSIAMSDITNAAGVIQMSPTATNPQVTVGAGGVRQYVFRACFIDPFQGAAAARFARGLLSAQNAFILLDPANPYVKGLADAFQAEFSRSGAIVGKETYSSSDTDFSAILDGVAVAKPDVVFLPDYFAIVNLVTAQAKAKGITTPFVGGDGWDSTGLDTTAASGSYFTNHFWLEDPRPEVSVFHQAFSDRFGYAPDAVAALAYDAAKLLFQAMQEAGTTDTAVVKTRLETIAFQGVTGAFFYDTSHNPAKSAAVMRVQSDGVHFATLISPQRPAADLVINYNRGSPGSSFTVTGSNFPPNSLGTIKVNGHAVTETIAVSATGGFAFQLGTTGADEGSYYVTVAANPTATTRFGLDAAAPLRPPEGGGAVVAVPGGIAYTRVVYLPRVLR